jgi:uncharacterized protein
MLKFLIAFVSNLLVSVLAFAGSAKTPVYKVEKNGESAYLFGTIHTGVNYQELSPTVIKAFYGADTLVVETDMAAAQPLIAQAFPLGSGGSLRSQLTEQEFQTLYTRVAPFMGPGAAQIENLHPVMANILYSFSTLPETKEPIDQTLLSIAAKKSKPVQYFETPQVQVDALLKTMTIETLRKSLNTPIAELQAQTDALVKAYVDGDMAALENSFATMTEIERQVLMIDRNLAWIAKFDGLFGGAGKEFFAVGAGHLIGEQGLIQLLRDKGYAIEQIQ